MSAWCLIQSEAEKFIQGLKSGSIDVLKMAVMSSEDRHAYIEQFISKDNATQVNALFESKLLLTNQRAGFASWISKVGNLKPEVKADLVSKIAKLDKVLSPEEGKFFLKDLAQTKLGVGVSESEAKHIFDLSQAIKEAQANITDKKGQIAYGNAILDLHDYTSEITSKKANFIANVANIANIPRTAMSSVDFSAPFRQGFGLIAHPSEFANAFSNMFRYATSPQAHRDLMASIITDSHYELAKSAGLRITTLTDKLSQREEAFASSVLDRVPGIAASERAYTGFLNKMRFDVFKKAVDQAKSSGEDISRNSQVVKDIASVVNNFTGSGDFGKNDKFGGAVPLANAFFFSPRKLASSINILNPVTYARLSPTARSLALRNVIGMVGVSASILTLAKMSGAKVETDPNSSDFGKIIVGTTRIDATGGNAAYLTLLSRLVSGKTKNSINQITTDLKAGVGSQSKADVGIKFLRNKLSPVASFIADYLYGKDSSGNPFNVTSEIQSRVMPLVIQDGISSFTQDPSNALLSTFLDTFGFGVQTYGTSGKNWNNAPTTAQSAFLNKVGPDKFQQANNDYNSQYDSWLTAALKNPSYQNLSQQSKQSVITAKQSKLQSQIFKQYGFVYVPPKPQPHSESKQAVKSLVH